MGLTRKIVSVSTAGLVNYRNPEERSAKYSKQTRNAARAQVAQQAMNLELQRQQIEALNHANAREAARPQAVQANWYPDPGNPSLLRWHDGTQWTQHTRENVPPPPPPGY